MSPLSIEGLVDAIKGHLRRHRLWLIPMADGVTIVIAWNVTYLFRLGFDRWLDARPAYDHWVLSAVVMVYLSLLGIWRVPSSLWRFTGFAEIRALVVVCSLAGVVVAAGVVGAGLSAVPRSVVALHPFFTVIALAMTRVTSRVWHERSRMRSSERHRGARRAVVLGAGDAARRLLAGLQQQGWEVIGLLDDDATKWGVRISGADVLGPLANLPDLLAETAVSHVIVAMPSASSVQRRRVLSLAAESGLPVLTVPGAGELIDESQRIGRFRDVRPEDLLGRSPVELDEAGIAVVFGGQTVLITGAGGSIGSELCRQVARYGPRRLVLYEASEFNLYSVEQELSRLFPQLELVPLIGDVRDREHLGATFMHWRPDLVLHAAAYKHVPLMEERNAWSAIRNNTLGTWNAAQAAADAGVGRFVLISTDKAVNPTNVMGATKRAAEMVVALLAQEQPSTRFMAVRFGNVLGSSGSVIPKFKEQIALGGPVTVTHPDIIRYFMTIPEAARLVLQAAVIGATGQVLVLDMGEPVRIADLARDMIRLSGHLPEDISIRYTGLRPGEKLYEELLVDSETTMPTSCSSLRVARLAHSTQGLKAWLQWAQSQTEQLPDVDVREALKRLVPEYQPPHSATP